MNRTSLTLCFVLLIALACDSMGQNLRLTVDRGTGAVGLENIGTDPVAVKGYTIGSPGQFLNPDDWISLANAGEAGWVEANPSATHLSELNRDDQAVFGMGESVSFGSPYVVGPQKGDVFFEYITTDLEIISGPAHFTGPANDLAVYVDPETGDTWMANLSPFIDPPTIKGYSILSPSGGMTVGSWTSMSATGSGGVGWIEANPAPNHLSELNRDDKTTFEENTVIPLGKIVAPGSDTRDLVFEYFTSAGDVLVGSVEYIPLPGTPDADCNGDGVVDAMDLACQTDPVTLASLQDQLGVLPGDFDGMNGVDFADFLALSANFGLTAASYGQGDINLDRITDFTDFLVLSANFGMGAGATAAAVPEPTGLALYGLGGLLMSFGRHRRRQ